MRNNQADHLNNHPRNPLRPRHVVRPSQGRLRELSAAAVFGMLLSASAMDLNHKPASAPGGMANVPADSVSAPASAPVEDSRVAQMGARLGEIAEQLRSNAEARKLRQLQAAPAQLQNAAPTLKGADVQIHLRPGNGTVMHIRGTRLQAPVKGVGLAAAGDLRERTARTFLRANRGLLRLADPDNELELTRSHRDAIGQAHLRFAQAYRGLPVWPASLSVHLDPEGNVTSLDGAYVPSPELEDLEPRVSPDEALARARAASGVNALAVAADPQLIIYAPLSRAPRLAWKFDLTASALQAWVCVVDALQGRMLYRGERVLDANVSGSGADLGGTTRGLNVWQQSGTYYLVDTSKKSFESGFDPLLNPHGVISIADAQGTPANEVLQTTVGTVSSSSATDWSIPAAVSAAFNFSQTYDYYLDRHGRNSVDGQGGNITAIVRVGNYDNASWHGNLRVMLFGEVQPYAGSLDVVGHELTHGVTETSSGLLYESQSGALNEAFSDIFGEMIEARTRGRNDWLIGSELNRPFRNMRDPGSITSGLLGRGYPSKMSEFGDLPNTNAGDHGGVHVNSSIINHAFYLLAEGLDGAIGLRDAERIFFRCLTEHLQAQSQFIDCRLGCIASAEELFGANSTQARKTAEAFDAVEILSAPTTPDPTPVPVVTGPDSTLFVYYNPFSDGFDLGRREEAQGDGEYGAPLASDVHLGRPAVTGDGSFAFFVDPNFDLCGVETAVQDSHQCLGYAGMAHSVAVSPDGRFGAFVLRHPDTGKADGKIKLLNFENQQVKTYDLVAPSADGISVDTVLYADAMTFSTDGRQLIYDAISELKFGNGPTVQRWSIYSLDLVTERTSVLVPPREGVDTGNPSFGRAGNRYLVYDALQLETGVSSIVVLDLFTGEGVEVGATEQGFGYPAFLGDESAVVYAARDPNAISGYSLVKQDLVPNRVGKKGDATLWYEDAALGVIYRRGAFQSTNALPTVSLTASVSPGAPGTVSMTATASDPDGSIAKVEFYQGADKVGQATTAPYSFAWQNVPAGRYRLTARATDNVGGAADSATVEVIVGGVPPAGGPKLRVQPISTSTVRLVLTGTPGDYVIEQSSDFKSWAGIYPVTIDSTGVGSVDDSGGPANFRCLFYRVRKD